MHHTRGVIRRLRFRAVVLVLGGVSGIFAACGGDDDASDVGGADASTPDAAGADTSTGTVDAPSEPPDDAAAEASIEEAGADAAGPDAADDGGIADAGPELPLRGPVDFSTMYGHTCALRDGGVKCWGWNKGGALGAPGLGEYSASPVTVQGLNDVIEITTGGSHSCALRSDRTVACWGLNDWGQLGQGASGPAESDVPLPVPGLTNVRSVAAAFNYTCAIKDDRSVVCWGRNEPGALGLDAGARLDEPVALPDVANAELLAGNAYEACVVHSDRTVTCWGYTQKPHLIPGATNVVSVVVGFGHVCALRADRTVACWGSNDYGQLGPGAPSSSAQARTVTGLDDVVAIGAGYYHTCAVRSGGDVVCWGRNQYGSLGSAIDASAPFSAVPVPVAITDALVVSGGYRFACARRVGDKVSCWGDNNIGQLGGGTDAGSSAVPVEVVGF